MLTDAPPPPIVRYAPGVDIQTAPFGTVLTFRGSGWAPGASVVVSYSGGCGPLPPDTACAETGHGKALHTDRHGRFTFRFRIGRMPPKGPGPKAAGEGEPSFSGRTRAGRLSTVLGARRPRPATAAQRAEAQAIASALKTLSHGIRDNAEATQAAVNAGERASGRCQDVLDDGGSKLREAVVGADLSAASDAETIGVDAPLFAAFTQRLEAIHATDPELAAGLARWLAALHAPRHVPAPSLCDELRAWRDTGWDPARAPIAPGATTLQQDLYGDRAIGAGAIRLRELGADRDTVDDWRGLLLVLQNFITVI